MEHPSGLEDKVWLTEEPDDCMTIVDRSHLTPQERYARWKTFRDKGVNL